MFLIIKQKGASLKIESTQMTTWPPIKTQFVVCSRRFIAFFSNTYTERTSNRAHSRFHG